MISVVVLSTLGNLNPPLFHAPYSLKQIADGDEVLDDLINLTVFIAEVCDEEPMFPSITWSGHYYFCCPDTHHE
jgi:hypothetical protein